MFSKRQKTRKYIWVFIFCLLTFTCSTHASTIPKEPRSLELKKTAVSTLLHGLASACKQLASTVTAETEKQQVTLDVLESLFTMAGDLTNQQTNQQADQQKNLTKTTTTLTAHLIKSINIDSTWPCEKINTPLLTYLTTLKNGNELEQAIKSYLQTEKTSKSFHTEVFYTLKHFIAFHVPDLIQNMHSQIIQAIDSDQMHHPRAFSSETTVVDALNNCFLEKTNQQVLALYLTDQIILLTDYMQSNFFA